jgi:MerR family redox-sensitive transcriptional activator SoxR
MSSLSIGEVAQKCGVTPSTIRYYEKAGLIPRAMKVSRQRRFTTEEIGWLRLVLSAREAGFTIAETRIFITGFSGATRPATRWRMLAERKLVQIAQQMARLENMKRLLESSFRCECQSIADCARLIGKT